MAYSDYVSHQAIGGYPVWQNRPPLLGHLDLELTERCNNDCIHCCINRPASDSRAQGRELRTEEWQRILGEAAALGALSVRFTGGEPLLREDFADLYLFARRLGLKVLLYTNARLITPQVAGLLARVPALSKVEITVYGMRRESYEVVTRVLGSHAEFRRGVEMLKDRGVPFIVKGTLLPPNQGEATEFEEWAKTVPEMDHLPGYATLLELRGRRDSEARNRLIRRLRLTPENVVAELDRRGVNYRRARAEFCSRFLEPPGDRLFDCGAGRGGCVDAYGALQPCMGLRDPALSYDLRRGSLREALVQVFPALRERRAANPKYLERCSRCFLLGLCEQCPAKSWAEHGTLDTPVEYLCQVAHAEARYLGLLAKSENAWEVADWRGRIKILEETTSQ